VREQGCQVRIWVVWLFVGCCLCCLCCWCWQAAPAMGSCETSRLWLVARPLLAVRLVVVMTMVRSPGAPPAFVSMLNSCPRMLRLVRARMLLPLLRAGLTWLAAVLCWQPLAMPCCW
jgi:hypothetical protein